MSGGTWNYQQDIVSEFGKELAGDNSPIIAATGAHLVEIAACLREADLFFAGDTSEWDKDKLARLLPNDAFRSVALKMISEANLKLIAVAALVKEGTK